jgi:two-component system cell cycle sensor histidine kinase/response regulator CckA
MQGIKKTTSSFRIGRSSSAKMYLRVVLPALVSVLIFGLTVFFFIQPHIESIALDARRELIRGISQTGWQMVDNQALQVDMGSMDRPMAQSLARQMMRSFRYGPHGMDYFWVVDLNGTVQVNPFRNDLEGRNALKLHDDKGKFFIKQAIEMAKNKGDGFLTYSWQKGNSKDFRQKLVYVRLYVPWGWVIGTGVYLDDVEAELQAMLGSLALVGLGVSLTVLILAALITLRQVRSERRRLEAEGELKETLDKYRAVQAAAPNPLVVYDHEGMAVYINPSFTQTFGWKADELIGKRIDFVPEDEKSKTLAAINAVYADPGRTVSFETKRSTKGKRILDVRISAATFRDASGKPIGMIVNLLDISESKAAERALRLSERRYRNLFESANDAIVIFAGNIIEDCNDQALKMFGLSREEFLGPHEDFLSPEKQPDGSVSMDVIKDRLRKAKSGEHLFFEWQYYRKDGSLFDVEMSLQYVDLPGGPRFLSMARDVTSRKMAEAALKESEERVRTVMNATPLDIVCFKDAEGRWLEGNKEIVSALGLEGKEYLGKTSPELAEIANPGARDLLRKAMDSDEDAFNSGLVMREELVLYNPSGKPRVFDVVRVPLFDDEDRRKGIVVVGRDITERVDAERQRKEMESQLRHSQKMEAIGTLAGGVAHDFNNILTAIIGYTETAMNKAKDGAELRRGLKIVLDSSFRARDLVKQLLTFSRGRETSLQVLDLASVVGETMNLVKAVTPSMIRVHTETKAHETVVKADPIQMQQVIMNLCTNAVQAMEDDGGLLRVILDTLHVDQGEIPPHPNMAPGDYVVLEVSDTGPGIDDETAKNIFDPFFTTKPRDKGTGLGLSVVHGIVTSIEGAVVVDSRTGTGATFRVYLPRSFEHPEADALGAGGMQLPEGQGTLLLVEDEPLVMRVEQEILESLGYEVVAFPSPVEARNLFERDPDRFDLVITDYAMPNMSGLELASSLKETAPNIPILMCTGYNQNISVNELKLFGIDKTLMKPFTAIELGRVLQDMLKPDDDGANVAAS